MPDRNPTTFKYRAFPIQYTRLSILSSHRVYRVPDFLASRLNWLPHPLPRKLVCPPRIKMRGGGTHTCLRRRGLGSQLRRRDRYYGIRFTDPFSLFRPIHCTCVHSPLSYTVLRIAMKRKDFISRPDLG